MTKSFETTASAPGLGVEKGPLQGVAGGPRAGGLRARPVSLPGAARVVLLAVASFLAGIAVAGGLWLSLRGDAAAAQAPTGIDRTWSTSDVARYLGLGDASSFSSGIVCQLYFEKKRPYTWVVSLCHH